MRRKLFSRRELLAALLSAGVTFPTAWELSNAYRRPTEIPVTRIQNSTYTELTRASEEETASYVVFIDGSTIKAKNGSTGQIEFLGIEAATVIQNAINALTSGMILIRAGSYEVNTPIVPKNNTSLVGELGTVLRGTSLLGTHAIVERFGSAKDPVTNVRIVGIDLDGANMATLPYNTARKGIGLSHVKRGVFRDLYIHNTPASGFGVDFMVDSFVHNCVVESCGTVGETRGSNGFGIGIGAFAVEPTVVSDCIARNNANNGFLFEDVLRRAAGDYHSFADCISYGNRTGYRVTGGKKIQFVNCTAFQNGNRGMLFSRGTDALTDPEDIIVSHCLIDGNTGEGIEIDSTASEAQGFAILNTDVINNTSFGIRAPVNRSRIENCRIATNGKTGIYLAPVAGSARSNILIVGNQVYNNGTDVVSGQNDGIRIDGETVAVNDVLIANNHCFDAQTPKKQRYGVVLAGTLTSVVVSGNDLQGNLTGALFQANLSRLVIGNLGFNPQPIAPITVGPSRFTYTNNDGYPEEVQIVDGAVTTVEIIRESVATDLGITSGVILLQPKDALRITYSAPPTMRKIPH